MRAKRFFQYSGLEHQQIFGRIEFDLAAEMTLQHGCVPDAARQLDAKRGNLLARSARQQPHRGCERAVGQKRGHLLLRQQPPVL